MNCEQIKINLLDYAEGRLSQPECEEIREHLGKCTECAAFLKEEIAFSNKLRSIESAQPDNDVWALVRARTKPSRWHLLKTFGGFAKSGYRMAAAAAVIAVLLFAAIFSLTLTNNQQKSPEMSAQVKSSVTQVKWSDDPMGSQTDATIEYINNM